jgi:outer membrane protein OmpA-like peptidoglycan-associated protein
MSMIASRELRRAKAPSPRPPGIRDAARPRLPPSADGKSRRCACGGSCPRCRGRLPIQAKLVVSHPGDIYEHEADRVADEIMRMPDGLAPRVSRGGTNIQRKCAACSTGKGICPACAEEEKKPVQRKAERQSETTNPSVPDNFLQDVGPGQPLNLATRAFFEARLGHDLGGVRVHADRKAASLSESLAARAFTAGNHIWFGAGEYAPHSHRGKRLLAHELVHTVQQRSGPHRVQRTPVVTNCEAAERANIIRAQARARVWLAHAVSRLARPQNLAAELAYHFRTAPTDTRAIGMIRDELQAVRGALGNDLISYNCAPQGHADCEGEFVSGFAYLSSYDANFCMPAPSNYGNDLVALLIHEAIHALAPGIPDGPYISDRDYPGDFPLNNTDAYTNFAKDVATDLIGGVARPPEAESPSIGNLPGEGYGSSSGPWGVESRLAGFPENDATLTGPAQRYLDIFLEDWADNVESEPVVLRLAGHTDGQTPAERNRDLGEYRAEAVRDYLLQELRNWRITAPVEVVVATFAHNRPYTGNRTARGRALNRRVEMQVRRLTPRR